MRFLGKNYLFFYVILAIFSFLILSPAGNIRLNNLLADLTGQLIVSEVNPIREDYGFLKLKINEKLTKAAQKKANDMVARNYFSHSGPDGETPWSFLDGVGYDFVAAGENLAIDASDTTSLVNAWLNSPSHAKNILNGYFIDIGIGIAKGEVLDRQTTVVVMFLGRERGESLALAVGSEIDRIVKNNKPKNLTVVSDEQIKDVKPQEMVVTKKVAEDDLYKENLVLAAGNELIDPADSESTSQSTASQILLLNGLPELFRLVLTVIYAGVIFLAMLELMFQRQRNRTVVSSSIIVLALIVFIWIP